MKVNHVVYQACKISLSQRQTDNNLINVKLVMLRSLRFPSNREEIRLRKIEISCHHSSFPTARVSFYTYLNNN